MLGILRCLTRKVDSPCVYLCGNSLGLMPFGTKAMIEKECHVWAQKYAISRPLSSCTWLHMKQSVLTGSDLAQGCFGPLRASRRSALEVVR